MNKAPDTAGNDLHTDRMIGVDEIEQIVVLVFGQSELAASRLPGSQNELLGLGRVVE